MVAVDDGPSAGNLNLEGQFTNVLRIADHVDLKEAIAHLAALENIAGAACPTKKAYDDLFAITYDGVSRVFEQLDENPHDTRFALYGGGTLVVSHLGNPVINREISCPPKDRLTVSANKMIIGVLGDSTFEPRTQVHVSAWEFARAATSGQAAVEKTTELRGSNPRRSLFVGDESMTVLSGVINFDLASLQIPKPGMIG